MLDKQIPNPYVAHKISAGTWCVSYRYTVKQRIQFKAIAKQLGEQDAKLIARLMNKWWTENNKIDVSAVGE